MCQRDGCDYLIAFLPTYVLLMVFVGAQDLLIRPIVERTLYSARYYMILFAVGLLYFGIFEGIWGAGFGKRLKGLHVARTNGHAPGIGRALLRILVPILCAEGIRVPLMMASISDLNLTGMQVVWFVVTANICPWLTVLLTLTGRPENGFATVWDLVSGTRVVVTPKHVLRPAISPIPQPKVTKPESLGPYKLIGEIVPGKWFVGHDPVLRRQVWLLKRASSDLSVARRNVARVGRLRWLQKVETEESTWDAFEATEGVPFISLIAGGKRVRWTTLRYWLHDLASEMWAARRDQTLPGELCLDHVWITASGQAVLLDEPSPALKAPAELVPVEDIAGQQRFLNAVAAYVEPTSIPLHARPALKNLADGRFEKLSFLTGNLRGLLEKPAEVSKGIRAGAIFMLPVYTSIAVLLPFLAKEEAGWARSEWYGSVQWIALVSVLAVLAGSVLVHLMALPVRSTCSHAIFRLAVVNAKGEPAAVKQLFVRWLIVWLPLFIPVALVALFVREGHATAGFLCALVVLSLWISAAVYAVLHPYRGLPDRLAGTWFVRR